MSSGYFGQSAQQPQLNLNQDLSRIGEHSSDITDPELAYDQQAGTQELALQGQSAQQALSLYPQMATAERAATSAQRTQDAQDLRTDGPQIQAALNKINPGWQATLGQVNAQTATATQQSPLLGQLNTAGTAALGQAAAIAPSALMNQLNQGAEQQLALGSSLSPDQQRNIDQASQEAFAQRGLQYSNPAIVNQVENLDAAGQQRLQQRESYAAGVESQSAGEQAQQVQEQLGLGNFAGSVQGMNQSSLDAGRQYLLSAQQANQSALNPVLGVFGQRTDVSPMGASQMMSSAPNTVGAGAQAMNPILSFGQDTYDTNFNADAATAIDNANNMAAIHGAIIGAVGSMAGGAMKACWVAREVLAGETVRVSGNEWPKWYVFRLWLSYRAPAWFRRIYLRYGERFAGWLRPRPWARRMVRPWFEQVVADELDRLEVLQPLIG